MTAATIRRAAGFLAGLGLAAATLAGAPILPSYSRAITSPFFGRIDEIVVAMDFNGDGWQDILVGGDGRFGSSCLVPPNRPLPAPMRVLISSASSDQVRLSRSLEPKNCPVQIVLPSYVD